MEKPVTHPNRCGWVHDDPIEVAYHDQEWGVPLHDDRKLFEFLVLDGFQAGLSWLTILRKRAAFREAFDGFDPERVARYDTTKQQALLQDRRIVRNRLKIKAASTNAKAFLQIQKTFGSFDAYLWAFVDGQPIQNAWPTWAAAPATSPLSDALSRDLKQRGFTFVGSTICYAFMQAAGLVNDHAVDCFRYREIQALYRSIT
ncbi:DNA-3-methyladenine glycosylase [Halomicronema hongdechloris C2206]|uniref:DNA-3-methyladenine glycosylase I n=1 Tax=Halomicronema hongdechloris C2206 TaxID=1641165 RepID=A0A1Z3HU21_9CYAN|nr:DNA-3-methyladenine glycosylase I [Halomicronema hongdechloris]ASC73804.1 DNA-3-methyladenine glycosylase [Halomicronema hongdechloris C2206]